MQSIRSLFGTLLSSFLVLTACGADNREANEQIVALYGVLQPGMTKEAVVDTAGRDTYRLLKVEQAEGGKVGVFTAPGFMARDWVLWIEFKGGCVSSIYILTRDGPPPSEAPPPKASTGACGAGVAN